MTRLQDCSNLWIHDKATGCFVWVGAVFNHNGHKRPRIRRNYKDKYAVNFICDELKGPLPKGLTRSHICKNKLCVNPDHIVYETLQENVARESIEDLRRRSKPGQQLAVKAFIKRAERDRNEV